MAESAEVRSWMGGWGIVVETAAGNSEFASEGLNGRKLTEQAARETGIRHASARLGADARDLLDDWAEAGWVQPVP